MSAVQFLASLWRTLAYFSSLFWFTPHSLAVLSSLRALILLFLDIEAILQHKRSNKVLQCHLLYTDNMSVLSLS